MHGITYEICDLWDEKDFRTFGGVVVLPVFQCLCSMLTSLLCCSFGTKMGVMGGGGQLPNHSNPNKRLGCLNFQVESKDFVTRMPHENGTSVDNYVKLVASEHELLETFHVSNRSWSGGNSGRAHHQGCFLNVWSLSRILLGSWNFVRTRRQQ